MPCVYFRLCQTLICQRMAFVLFQMALQRAKCDYAIIKAEDLDMGYVTAQIILILTLYHSREGGYQHRPKLT